MKRSEAPPQSPSRRLLLGGLLALGLAAVPRRPEAAPKAVLWERWLAYNPSHGGDLDHGPWQRLLDRRRREGPQGIARLDYGGVTAEERRQLDAYLAGLSATEIRRFGRAAQRAFWINLYNALTLRLVLESYPLTSIRDLDISPGLLAEGPWGAKLVTVEGEALSLDDIEHRILRPIWQDNRLHYAVNCASLGCPNLAAEAFTAENGERLLSAGARDYVNHPRGARFEAEGLIVSSLYLWYREDFGDSERGILEHLSLHAAPELRSLLAATSAIAGHGYDWRLNDLASGA